MYTCSRDNRQECRNARYVQAKIHGCSEKYRNSCSSPLSRATFKLWYVVVFGLVFHCCRLQNEHFIARYAFGARNSESHHIFSGKPQLAIAAFVGNGIIYFEEKRKTRRFIETGRAKRISFSGGNAAFSCTTLLMIVHSWLLRA